MSGMKRGLDVSVAAIALVLAAPLIAGLALWIWIAEGRPLFYRSRRVGEQGRTFVLWKLRTMTPDADRSPRGSVTVADDPRITASGRVLRSWKLDELPQLFNVLLGDLSLVGPRPEVPGYVVRYTPDQREILRYRPGLTSPATLAFVDEAALLARSPDPASTYFNEVMPEELRMDLEYMQSATFVSDVRVLFATLGAVFRRGRSA
jgi:lipopolysaccharide/colanic/teichoic acid biosynthesis glycosyltransferase